jgi:GNAT superfamily N-acetyltransferase
VIAWMWSNLNFCDSRLLQFPLRENEAYLTGANTLEEFRGRNLAPWLRLEFYRRLRDRGKTKICSITEYFNRPAFAFKKKLGAKPLGLYLHVLLFKKLAFTFRLKKY